MSISSLLWYKYSNMSQIWKAFCGHIYVFINIWKLIKKLFSYTGVYKLYFAEVPLAALQNCEKGDEVAKTDEFGAQDYRKILELKLDHGSRPLWVVCIILLFWITFFQLSICILEQHIFTYVVGKYQSNKISFFSKSSMRHLFG